ncbi:hypothetical protein E4O00_03155 [Treponema sp. OMZ 788]|nr:hypothetical protein E4O00_03155 [Treponema sp. OMZ 788]
MSISVWCAFLTLDFINEYIATQKIQAVYASQVFDERELEDLSSLMDLPHDVYYKDVWNIEGFIPLRLIYTGMRTKF